MQAALSQLRQATAELKAACEAHDVTAIGIAVRKTAAANEVLFAYLGV